MFQVKNNIQSSYNNRYVIYLLLFSMFSLSLTWLIGIFVVIGSNLNNKSFSYLAEFFFCVFNSFHGISLLIAQYMAQKYSSFKTQYSLENNNYNTSSLATTSTSDGAKSIVNLAKSKKNSLFMKCISSNSLDQKCNQIPEIKQYNCIHVKNYGYTSKSFAASNNIDKECTSYYTFYHNNVNYVVNSQDDRNSIINIDYFININQENDKNRRRRSNKLGYVVSFDAFTSSI